MAMARLLRRFVTVAPTPQSAGPGSALSPREMEIMSFVERGCSNKAIARALSIGLPTVKNHVHNILEKLGVASRGEAVAVMQGKA
jgi:DNA-binding NarL/FixJ family response regulator